jgi:hypothetical protein
MQAVRRLRIQNSIQVLDVPIRHLDCPVQFRHVGLEVHHFRPEGDDPVLPSMELLYQLISVIEEFAE